MQTLQVIFFGLLALGLLVFVHELGHFLVAKAFRIKVLKFSLGFGQRVLGFTRGETEYLISALPLGGYVKLAGETPDDVNPRQMQPGDYLAHPWWERLAVLLAGPVMNLLTSAVLLSLLFGIGFQAPLARPQVVSVEKGSAAEAAGLLPGDVISELGGVSLADWEKFSERFQKSAQAGRPVSLRVLREGNARLFSVPPRWDAPAKNWRLGVGIAPASTTVLERVLVGTPAELAHLRAGDRVVSVEGKPVFTKYDFQKMVWPRVGRPTRLELERAGLPLAVTVTPIGQMMPEQGQVGVIGVAFKVSDQFQAVSYPWPQAVALGSAQTFQLGRTILISLGQMVSGRISAKESLGGPITIMRMAGQEARAGLKDFCFFLAGISVMLAMINLLPVPMLDGGTAVFFILEGIFRRPLPLKVQAGFQRVGFALLLALMVYATYNDVFKLIASWSGTHP